MKNIIITGTGRNGKTTLAKKINEELRCFVINLDKLMTAFDRAYPQLDIRIAWDYWRATANISPFIGHYLGLLSTNDGYADKLNLRKHAVEGNRFVLEGSHFDFDKILPILNTYGIGELKDKFILIGLVQKEKTAQEFFDDLRRYDTEDDWTYSLADDYLMELCEIFVSHNQEMLDCFVKYGFTVYDTSGEREHVFNKIIDDIKSGIV